MLLAAQKLRGAQIVSLHTGQIIAKTTGVIIDPDKLGLIGFYCQTSQTGGDPLVLLSTDIRQAAAGRLFINSFDELTLPSELVKFKSLFDLNFDLVDKPVKTASHHKLGKVEDYAIESLGWVVQKLYVKQPILRSFGTPSLVIDRQQIIEVTDKDITVNDAVMTKPALVPARAPEVPAA